MLQTVSNAGDHAIKCEVKAANALFQEYGFCFYDLAASLSNNEKTRNCAQGFCFAFFCLISLGQFDKRPFCFGGATRNRTGQIPAFKNMQQHKSPENEGFFVSVRLRVLKVARG